VPDQLSEALRLRARGRDVILFAFSNDQSDLGSMWGLMTQNLILHLVDIGYDHYIALSGSPEDCEALHASWVVQETVPSCAFSSEPANHTHDHNIWGLWSERWYVVSLMAERGYDVLFIDVDWRVFRDVYPVLNSPPLDAYHAVIMGECPINGGTAFVRGSKAHARGGVLWLVREVERRTTRMLTYGGPDPGVAMDQTVLGDALRNVQHNLSQNDFYGQYSQSNKKDAPFWRLYPQPASSPAFQWMNTVSKHSTPWPDCPAKTPAECQRWSNFKREFGFENVPIRETRACTPFDSEYYDPLIACERIAVGPHWLWMHGEGVSHGWLGAAAGVHLLSIEKNWAAFQAGSHAGRLSLLVAEGLVDPRLLPAQPFQTSLPRVPAYDRPTHSYDDATAMLRVVAERSKGLVVFQNISCQSSWIQHSNLTRTGLLDWRIVQTPDGACWPSNAGFDTCFVHLHFAWSFMAHTTAVSSARRTVVSPENVRASCPQFFGEGPGGLS
jgi:hypothetical protein